MDLIEGMLSECDSIMSDDHFDRRRASCLVSRFKVAFRKELIDQHMEKINPNASTPETIDLIRVWLISHRERAAEDIERERAKAGSISVASFSNSSSVSISNVSIDGALSTVDEMDYLSDEEKSELKRLLHDCEKSKGKGKIKLFQAIKKLLEWLIDKGIENIPAILNYISVSLQ